MEIKVSSIRGLSFSITISTRFTRPFAKCSIREIVGKLIILVISFAVSSSGLTIIESPNSSFIKTL